MPRSPLTMTPKEVAYALCVSEGAVCRMWKRGDLPRPTRVGRSIRFMRAEIMEYLEAQRQDPTCVENQKVVRHRS